MFTPKLEEMIQFWTGRHILSDGLKLNQQPVPGVPSFQEEAGTVRDRGYHPDKRWELHDFHGSSSFDRHWWGRVGNRKASQGKHKNSAYLDKPDKPTKACNSKLRSHFLHEMCSTYVFFLNLPCQKKWFLATMFVTWSSMWFVDVMNCANHTRWYQRQGLGDKMNRWNLYIGTVWDLGWRLLRKGNPPKIFRKIQVGEIMLDNLNRCSRWWNKTITLDSEFEVLQHWIFKFKHFSLFFCHSDKI